MKLGLRARFITLISIVLLVVYGSIAAILVRSTVHQQAGDLNRESMAFASLATKPIGDTFQLYQDSGTIKIGQETDRFTALDANVSNIQILSATGKPEFSHNNSPVNPFREDEATSFTTVTAYGSHGQITQIIEPYLSDNGAHPFNILYQISDVELGASLHHAVVSIIAFSFIGLLVSAAAMYLLINRLFLRPIEEVSRLATGISLGNYDQQIRLDRKDEIGTLAGSVDRMADALKADIAKLQEVDKVKSEFMAISSHNLRTPLTIINAYLESIESVTSVDVLKKALTRIGASVKRLDGFAEDVLTISKFELGGEQPEKELVNIGDFMERIAAESLPTAQLSDLQFSSGITTDAEVMISKPHVRSAVWNILDNAIKFTPKGGWVKLKVDEVDGMVAIAVSDNGIGITDDEVPKLFTKFHRGTSVTTYDYEGTGIGLYATKLIIEQQGGTIAVQTAAGKGSTFTIKLPVVNPGVEAHSST
jgi:signal transduction histidine kinase